MKISTVHTCNKKYLYTVFSHRRSLIMIDISNVSDAEELYALYMRKDTTPTGCERIEDRIIEMYTEENGTLKVKHIRAVANCASRGIATMAEAILMNHFDDLKDTPHDDELFFPE